MQAEQTDDFALPPLREDLALYEAPNNPDGSPTWTLLDPIRNQFFRIGWQEFEVLSRWGEGSISKLLERIQVETTLQLEKSDIFKIIAFLGQNNLLHIHPTKAAGVLYGLHEVMQKQQWKIFLKSILFYKFRLLHPNNFLQRTLPYVKPLFSPIFGYIMLVLALLALYLVSQQWTSFKHTFSYFFNWQGLSFYFLTLFLVKFLHELGHAYTATYYGCRIPNMGILLMIFWPVFYTDTTEAWKLPSRQQRLAIGAAGILVELALAVFATLLWVILPDGVVRSAMYFTATVSWVLSLLLNANPFMRYDGYYILSDWLNISNIQTRAFVLAKWQLRRWLFGFQDPPPANFPAHIQHILVAYAFGTFIYRFFLMLGISLLLYHLFFKFAGLLLMIVATLMYIVAPIAKELKLYYDRRDQMQWNKNTVLTGTGALLFIFLVVVPWHTSIVAPALLEYQQHTKLYAPDGAQVVKVNVKNDQYVEANTVLIELDSAELDNKVQQVKQDIAIIEYRISKEAGHTAELGLSQTDQSELATKNSELASLEAQRQKLMITAPFAGTVEGLNESLSIGQSIKKNLPLCEIIDSSHNTITAYVQERDYNRLRSDKTAIFFPDAYNASPVVKAQLITIDPVSTTALEKPYLASTFGGSIAVQGDRQQLAPKEALYRVVLAPITPVKDLEFVTRGTVRLSGSPISLLGRVWTSISAVLIRESGF